MIFYLLLLCLLLPACGNQTTTSNKFVYDFAESVTLIRHLLKTDSIYKILEDVDQQGLERLINNFSPAQMALESEVLNCTLPVLIYFYEKNLDDADFLEQLAQKYDDKIKIVTIDADAFFSIAEQFEIQRYPAVIFMHKRDIIHQMSDIITHESVEQIVSDALRVNG